MIKEKESFKIEAHKIELIKDEIIKLDLVISNQKIDLK